MYSTLPPVLLFLCALLVTVVGLVYIVLLPSVVTSCVLLYYVCVALLHTLVTGLLATSQYLEGPATGHLGIGFLGFTVSISKC